MNDGYVQLATLFGKQVCLEDGPTLKSPLSPYVVVHSDWAVQSHDGNICTFKHCSSTTVYTASSSDTLLVI